MLNVDIEKILPVTDARDKLNKIVDEVNTSDEMYVLTVNGKPSAVVVGVQHLEKLTGASGSNLLTQASTNSPTPPADKTTNPVTPAVEINPAEPLPTDSTPNQPLVGKDAEGLESPLPENIPSVNAAPTDTAQTTAPGPQQDAEFTPPEGTADDAAPLTTGQNITPDDPFATPGPADLNNTNQNQSGGTGPAI